MASPQWVAPLYKLVPGMAWLQFSYRLLVFVTICLALCGALVLDRVRARWGMWPALASGAACAVLMSLGKPWLAAGPVVFYDAPTVDAALIDEVNAPEAPEYRAAPLDLLGYEHLVKGAPAGCFATPLDDMTRERATARFAVPCTTGGSARLPIVLAPGMGFAVQGRRLQAFRACPEAWARLAVPAGAVVIVTFPTFQSALAAALTRRDPALACNPSDN